MRTFDKIALSVVGTLAFASCDYLEPRELTQVDEKTIYQNISYITQCFNNAYSYLPSGYNSVGNSLLACATDEAEAVKNEESIQNFNIGNWNKYSTLDDRWTTCYNGIRQCCEVRDGIAGTSWEEYKYANPEDYENRMKLMAAYTQEVRFLKAYYHYELLRRYGGIPIIDRKLDIDDPDDRYLLTHLKRNTFEECVNFIVGECDAVAPELPDSYGDTERGRVTRGAALALKSRVLLFAASDLYNRPGNADPYTGYTSGDRQKRWLAAAEAAQEVIDLGIYSLHNSYEKLFTLSTADKNNTEVIWERRLPATNTMEQGNYPIGYEGDTGTCPTQDLVDAYEMTDGTRFDWSNPEHRAAPYEKRDPRLKMSILVNGQTWAGRSVECWEGGLDGQPRRNATKTGYYLRKYLHDNTDLNNSSAKYSRQWLYFRYAEILLNYAEAACQYGGPDFTVPDALKPLSPTEAVNLVRGRSGVNMPSAEETFVARGETLTKESLLGLIYNERRVELVFEDVRWFDARRLMKGPEMLGSVVRGVKVTRNNDGSFSYAPFELEQRVFKTDYMYFYPIPQTEVAKSNGCLIQNPNW